MCACVCLCVALCVLLLRCFFPLFLSPCVPLAFSHTSLLFQDSPGRPCVGVTLCVGVCACVCLCVVFVIACCCVLSFLFIFLNFTFRLSVVFITHACLCVVLCVGSTSCVLCVVSCRAALFNFPPLNGFGLRSMASALPAFSCVLMLQHGCALDFAPLLSCFGIRAFMLDVMSTRS